MVTFTLTQMSGDGPYGQLHSSVIRINTGNGFPSKTLALYAWTYCKLSRMGIRPDPNRSGFSALPILAPIDWTGYIAIII